MKKIIFGNIHVDYLTMEEAIKAVIKMAERKRGGFVVTPNVDHIVIAEKNLAFISAYANTSISLADGKPLIWMSRLAGFPLPEKISGSDLVKPLLKESAKKRLRIYFLGSAPGVGTLAAKVLSEEIPFLNIVGVDSPPMGFETNPEEEHKALEKLLSANPDIVLFALGAPKQEILMHKWYKQGVTPVMLGIGASLDFIAGKIKRSPKWMSKIGLEWLYRLCREPKRLAQRYIVRDIGIFPVFFKMMKKPRNQRILISDYQNDI